MVRRRRSDSTLRGALAWAAPLALGLAMILAACTDSAGGSDNVPTRTPPADPAARFQELEKLRKAATFHIIYDRDPGSPYYRGLEFAWLQDGNRVRWEEASILEDDLGGTSSIDDGAGSGITCTWVTVKNRTMAEVSCDPVPRGIGMWILDKWLNGASAERTALLKEKEEVEFTGFNTILDSEVECYKTTFGFQDRDERGICYTAEGLPLGVVSVVGVSGDRMAIVLKAKEIRPPPSEAELLTPIIPDARLGQEVTLREVPLEDLLFPSMLIIEEYFENREE